MYGLWNFFLTHKQFTLLIAMTIVVLGAVSLISIRKESSPEINVPYAIVVTTLPGASAAEIEPLVTNVLERPLVSSLSDVNTISSVSGDGVSTITVEFDANADIDIALQELRDEVSRVSGQLPAEATDPLVSKFDFTAQPVLTVSISANVPSEVLYELGKNVQEELERVSGVSSVSVGGLGEREVVVLVKRAALEQYGLTLQSVAQALSAANVSFPVGVISVDDTEYPVRLDASLKTAEQIGSVPVITQSGSPVFIRSIATVIDGYPDTDTLARTSIEGAPSQPSLSLSVFKGRNENITDVSERVRSHLAELSEDGELLADAQVLISFDSGELLVRDLSTLGFSGLQTVMLVVLILALAIGWREALIAALAIPLSLLAAFIGMYYSDNTLNFISLFSLVLVIGILVDSAIVIVEGINARVRTYSEDDPLRGDKSAQDSLREFAAPIIAGTLTTAAVFAPLFLISGIVGEFIQSIPFTVLAVLISSLFVSLAIIPLVAARYTGRSIDAFGGRRRKLIESLKEWYRTQLVTILEHPRGARRVLGFSVLAFVLALSLPISGVLPTVFFESEDAEFMYVEIELPEGSGLTETDLTARRVEETLYAIPEIESFVTTVGRSSEYSGTGAETAKNLASMFIQLREDRDRTSLEIAAAAHPELQNIQNANIQIDQLADGPPTGSPLVVTLTGDNLDELDAAALRAADLLASISGTANVTSSADDVTTEFVISLDRGLALARGVTPQAVAIALRGALFGVDATELRGTSDDIDVTVRLAYENGVPSIGGTTKTDPEAVLLTPIPTQTGDTSLLRTFARVDASAGRTNIAHEDGERIARVTGEVAEGANAIVIMNEFLSRAGELALPTDITLTTGGETEDIDQSFREMFLALALGIIGMFAVLVLQFNSFRFALYVLMTVPLSLIGVFIGLMIANRPISFPAMMGFIALAGIIVNNAIILIDNFNAQRRENGDKPIRDVVVDGSLARLRPVLLTTLTTAIGIIPLIFTADIWVPLAIALMSGLLFATVLTLAIIPATYHRWPGRISETK